MNIEDVTTWLNDNLVNHTPAHEVYAAAQKAGVRPVQLEKAAERLDVRVGPGVVWFRP